MFGNHNETLALENFTSKTWMKFVDDNIIQGSYSFDVIKFHDLFQDFFDVFLDLKSRGCFKSNVKMIICLRYFSFFSLKMILVIFRDFA